MMMTDASSYEYCSDSFSLEKAKKELNEDPSMTKCQIIALRRWLSAQPHINCRSDDDFLLRFLRVCKFDQQKAQTMLDRFSTTRGSSKGASDWFQYPSLDNTNILTFLKEGFFVPLGQNDEGEMVVLFRAGIWDPEKVTFLNMIHVMNMSFDILLAKPELQIHGFVGLVDFEGYTQRQAGAWTKEAIAKLVMLQDSMPVRIRGVNYYRSSMIVNGIFEIYRLFMTDEVRQLVFWHKDNSESLKTKIPARLLPTEYDGEAGLIADLISNWCQTFSNGGEEFKSLQGLEVNEEKRPNQSLDFMKEYLDKMANL